MPREAPVISAAAFMPGYHTRDRPGIEARNERQPIGDSAENARFGFLVRL